MNHDLFEDYLIEEQQNEITSLRESNNYKYGELKKLQEIYKVVWEIIKVIYKEGSIEIDTMDKIFDDLNEAVINYDNHDDLRNKYK